MSIPPMKGHVWYVPHRSEEVEFRVGNHTEQVKEALTRLRSVP